MEEAAEPVEIIKSLMMVDVSVMRDSIRYLEDVEHVILVQHMKMEIVYVITDTMETEIFVNHVTKVVEHVADQELSNV